MTSYLNSRRVSIVAALIALLAGMNLLTLSYPRAANAVQPTTCATSAVIATGSH
jgi:hypothetical protein